MRDFSFAAHIFKEGETYVAYVPALDVSSCGATDVDARKNIRDAVRGFLATSADMGCELYHVHRGYADEIQADGILYQVTGDDRYAKRGRAILLAYADRYLSYPFHNTGRGEKKTGGRIGSQSLDESVWLIPAAQGADLIWDTLSEADRQTLADKLFLPAARDVIVPHRFPIPNIHCWENSGIGLTGFLLGDSALIQTAIDDPTYGYRAQMSSSVQSDGVWIEGARAINTTQ